jgi:O-antigen ligase
MVAVALVLLVEEHGNLWLTLPATVIIGREIAVSALREWMAELGQRAKVAVATVGKIKTVVQMVALGFLLYREPLLGLPIFRIGEWLLAAAAIGLVLILAGSRASWLTFALVLLWTGWRALGGRKLAAVFVAGALALAAATVVSPQVRERVQRTTLALTTQPDGLDAALSGRGRIWSAALCMVREHPVNGVGPRAFREAFPACDPEPGKPAAWGSGAAFHAHQVVLEVLSETGVLGLLLWLAGAALAWRAWRYAEPDARERARPAMLALAASVFPLNTHLAAYSTFWGSVLLLLAALYAVSLWGRDGPGDAAQS